MPLILLESLRGPGRAEDVCPVPNLGDRCVCCNQPSKGRKQHIVPTGQSGRGTLVMRDGMGVPVCSECDDHAIRRNPILAPLLCGAGLIAIAFVAVFPWGPASLLVLVAAILIIAIGVWSGMSGSRGERSARGREGHHPSFAVGIGRQWTQVTTSNLQLVDRMRLLNGNVRIAETWRERRVRKARGGGAARPRVSEAATAKLVQHVADNKLDDARALLATGTVDPIVAQRRLAELEAVLGARGLQVRLGKLLVERAAA